MPLLQVRDFPADVYEEISFEAKRQNRTIAQQTIVLIQKGLDREISKLIKLFPDIMSGSV
jgi:hypothetical protein